MQDKPNSRIGTASRGATLGTIQNQMQDVLSTYANRGTAAQLRGYPNYTGRLDKLMDEVINSGQVNGVDVATAMDQATSSVLTHSYLQFFKAMESKKPKEMEVEAEAILRLNKGVENAMKSMKARSLVAGRPFTPDQQKQVIDIFQRASESIKQSPEETAALKRFKAQVKARQKGQTIE